MYKEHAKRILDLLGKDVNRGVITAADASQAVATLEKEIADSRAHAAADDVKRDILSTIRCHYDVVMAVDDNPSVIALWEAEGIETIVVPGWCYDPRMGHAQPT